jgi:hypothetical protein
MQLLERDGKYIVDLKVMKSRHIMLDLDVMSSWCRHQWGDTDHYTNPEFKWRRRLFEFIFSREAHRTLFVMHFSNLSNVTNGQYLEDEE